ncbi:ras-related protein Rab-30-like isoform X2 [Mauremys reevesii]|uniref:ras-related protein Rab-30-like isoform X2 n=1 Tax=Mauremys reevesii TaxID=260615 RepID=UPI00193EFD9B|nr:ras-related protein Rab-30-like isoform X2 [Mauremys reevesii]
MTRPSPAPGARLPSPQQPAGCVGDTEQGGGRGGSEARLPSLGTPCAPSGGWVTQASHLDQLNLSPATVDLARSAGPGSPVAQWDGRVLPRNGAHGPGLGTSHPRLLEGAGPRPVMATAPPPGLRFKLILLGDFGVGKTTLFHRIRAGCFVPGPLAPNEHLAVCQRTVRLSHPQSPGLVQISLWDTAGEERFLSLSSCYYRGADAVLLLYSAQSQLSFDSLPHWVRVAQQYCPDALIFLLGNKTDLEPRLPEEKAERFSMEHEVVDRFNVSAKTGENVDRCMQDVVQRLVLKSGPGSNGLTERLQEADSSSPCAC